MPCAGEIIVTTPAEAQAAAQKLGGRIVRKILSSQITHKSGVGGVAVGLNAETVGARLTQMAADVESQAGVRPQRYLVQEMVDAIVAFSRMAAQLGDFLRAVVLGYEVSTRIGVVMDRPHYQFWHNTGTMGSFGANGCWQCLAVVRDLVHFIDRSLRYEHGRHAAEPEWDRPPVQRRRPSVEPNR